MRRLGTHPGRSLLTLLALLLSTLSGARAPAAGLLATADEEARSVTRPADEAAMAPGDMRVIQAADTVATRASSLRTAPAAADAPASAPRLVPGPRLGRARGARAP